MDELFPAPQTVPRVHSRKRWRFGGILSEDLTWKSLHEPIEPHFRRHYHARRRRIHTVYARRIRPDTSVGRPRLLYIHGYMQPETVVEELTLLTTMARILDMEVIQIQPPYHGRRKPRSSPYDGERFWTADVVRSLESLRQTLIDARTLLSIMQAESPAPVGVSGLSLGGAFTAVLTCLEPRFSFAAPLIGHMDMGRLLADAPVLGAMREDLARFGWTPRDFGELFTRIGWDELVPVIPKERIFIFAAEDDRFFPADAVREMWHRWGEPKIRWYPTSHMGFVPYLRSGLRDLRNFVDALELPSQE